MVKVTGPTGRQVDQQVARHAGEQAERQRGN